MNIGDVFYWITDQAIGHDSRPKFHIYVCPSDWVDDHTFLFVNKGMYGDDYKIAKLDYPFLDYDSYVSSFGIVAYDHAKISTFDMSIKGTITTAHLKEIMHVLDGSRTLERQQKKRICAALQKGVISRQCAAANTP
jgi:hypothetical protein